MNPLTFEMLALSSISAYSTFASLDRSARLSSIRNRGNGMYDAERLSILTDEILINIPQENIKPQVSDRYNKLRNIPEDLMQIIKTNGVSVNGQMSIYYALQRDITVHQQLISWTQMPSWNALMYVLSLCLHIAESRSESNEEGEQSQTLRIAFSVQRRFSSFSSK